MTVKGNLNIPQNKTTWGTLAFDGLQESIYFTLDYSIEYGLSRTSEGAYQGLGVNKDFRKHSYTSCHN